MFTASIVLIIILAVLLILVILIQNPKGGGLSNTFGGGSTQMFGVKKTTDILEQITWGLGIGIAVLTLSTYFLIDKTGTSGEIQSVNVDAAATKTLPPSAAAPATAPAPVAAPTTATSK